MLAQGVNYDLAGRITSMQFRVSQTVSNVYGYSNSCGDWGYYPAITNAYETESRSYNAMEQLTQITWSAVSSTYFNWGGDTISYTYGSPGTPTNGQITQMSDSLSGETVSYQYDALKRLTSACSSLSNCATAPTAYQYDGFGNLTSKVQNGGANPIPAVDVTTNRLTNASYDNNGNMVSGAVVTLTYDMANLVRSATSGNGAGTEYYGYSADNKRVWRVTAAGAEEWTLYGAKG